MIMNVVRIAKVVALLAFVLPWVAVSCQGVDAATATGIELAMGKLTTNPQFAEQLGGAFGAPADAMSGTASSDSPDMGLNFFAMGAAAAVLIGLALTFMGNAKSAGRNAIITSVVAAGLVFGSVWSFKESAKTSMAAEGGGAGPGSEAAMPASEAAMAASMMDQMVQERIGYWLALGALLVAGIGGAVAMTQGNAAIRTSGPPA